MTEYTRKHYTPEFKLKAVLEGIVNLFTSIDEFSPQWELFRAISAKNGVKLPEKEDLFPT